MFPTSRTCYRDDHNWLYPKLPCPIVALSGFLRKPGKGQVGLPSLQVMPRHRTIRQGGAAPVRLMPRHERSIAHHRGAAFLLISLVLAAMAIPVAADPIPLPPSGLDGKVHDGVVNLYWNGTGDAYNVYRNGVLLATTVELRYTDAVGETEGVAYVVTALRNGTESPPSVPWSPGQVDDILPPDCDLINSSSNLSEPPFIFWNFNDQCMRAWEAYIHSFLCGPPGCSDEDGS